jgi:hypothetical protein
VSENPLPDPHSGHSAKVRGQIALLSVVIYMATGAVLMLLAIVGLSSVDDSVRILQAWGSFSSLVVGAAIGFYFGAKS